MPIKDSSPSNRSVAAIIAFHSGNNWNVVKGTPLVTVGEGGQYETLADAISAAESGSIVKLVSDISVSSATSLCKDITLDLNGNSDLSLAGHLVNDSATASNASISGGYFGGNYHYGLDSNWIASGHTARQLTDSETDSTNAAAKAAGYKFVVE